MPLLFSYGTLQQENVQLATFGRRLHGHADQLVGFEQSLVEIEDPEVVATSGKTHHPIVKYSGSSDSRVEGTAFEITDAELEQADRYEVAAYSRVTATLASGRQAWVYVDARFAPGAPGMVSHADGGQMASTDAAWILARYCQRWNARDLDGLLALFREDAEYEGTSTRLQGRAAIEKMYRNTWETGEIGELVASTVPLEDGRLAVVLARNGRAVALKEFTFADGLIAGHNLIEDPNTLARRLAIRS